MPQWSRHFTPEALKDREQWQTDCRTHAHMHAHNAHNQKRNNTQTCTHIHTHTRHKWTPHPLPPSLMPAAGGLGVCSRRVAAQGQTSPWLPTGLIDHYAPLPPVFSPFFFSICISILLFPPWPFSSPFTFHPKLWLTHPRIYPIFSCLSSSTHHTLSLQLLSISFLSPVHKQIFHHREQAPFTKWNWSEVILLTEISRLWALKTKWK